MPVPLKITSLYIDFCVFSQLQAYNKKLLTLSFPLLWIVHNKICTYFTLND